MTTGEPPEPIKLVPGQIVISDPDGLVDIEVTKEGKEDV